MKLSKAMLASLGVAGVMLLLALSPAFAQNTDTSKSSGAMAQSDNTSTTTTKTKKSKKSKSESTDNTSNSSTMAAPSTSSGGSMASDTSSTKSSKSKSSTSTMAAAPPPEKGMVWVNTSSGVYHKEGDRYYGKTKEGKYMTEADAQKAGYHAAKEGAAKSKAKSQ